MFNFEKLQCVFNWIIIIRIISKYIYIATVINILTCFIMFP